MSYNSEGEIELELELLVTLIDRDIIVYSIVWLFTQKNREGCSQIQCAQDRVPPGVKWEIQPGSA